MAAEKKPRAAKAETKTTKTTKTTAAKKAATTKAASSKAVSSKAGAVSARKPKAAPILAEQVAERAYYIWAEGSGDDPFANWLRAERELQTA